MREVDDNAATAAYLGIPVESLRKWRSAGTGPPVAKVGRHALSQSPGRPLAGGARAGGPDPCPVTATSRPVPTDQ
jgi:hypothetical protein